MEDTETVVEVIWNIGNNRRSEIFRFCNDEDTCDFSLEELSKLISRLDALRIPWHVYTHARGPRGQTVLRAV